MSSPDFLSVDNMKKLIEIITSVINNKYKFDLTTSQINIKNIFLTIMTKVENDPDNRTLDITSKNKLTLKIVKEIIKTNLSLNIVNNRNNDIYSNRDVVYNNINTENTSFNTNNDVLDKMNQINTNTKNQNNIKEVKQLGQLNQTILDQSFNDTEFKKQLSDLETERSALNLKLSEMYPKDFIEERNKNISTIIYKKPEDIDPTAFFKQNNEINMKNNEEQNAVPPTYKNLAMSTLITKEPHHESRLEKRYILINSYDRNWIVDKYRYKYKIRFAYNTNEIMKIPYYDNNPTVPFTKTEKSSGIKNEFGWVDKNGVFHNPYDPSLPLTTNLDSNGKMIELGFEDVEIIVDQDASMIGTFKDIYSIKITNVSIPSDILNNYIQTTNNTAYYNFNFNFPYILCNIDEFQDVYDGTDDTIRKTFCQLQFDNYIQTPNGRGYIILKPVQNEIKYFYPNPLSSLSLLNISLTKPNGELLNYGADGQSILHISVYQTYYLKIITKTYFDKNAFCKGDYVKIKNFNLYQINSSMVRANVDKVNSFINKTEGHVIYNSGEPNDNGYYNNFYINGPGSFDENQGRFVVDETMTNTLSEFNNFLTENNFFVQSDQQTSSSDDYENGSVLNMSLQNSISMTIEMYKPDAMHMIKDKI